MQRAVGLRDTRDEEWRTDGLLEIDGHGNRTADPDKLRLLAERIAVSVAQRPCGGVVDSTHHRRSAAEHHDADLDPWRRELAHPLLQTGEHGRGVLVRHQAHAHLGERAGGDHCLLSFSDESAKEAVGVQRGPAPRALDR